MKHALRAPLRRRSVLMGNADVLDSLSFVLWAVLLIAIAAIAAIGIFSHR